MGSLSPLDVKNTWRCTLHSEFIPALAWFVLLLSELEARCHTCNETHCHWQQWKAWKYWPEWGSIASLQFKAFVVTCTSWQHRSCYCDIWATYWIHALVIVAEKKGTNRKGPTGCPDVRPCLLFDLVTPGWFCDRDLRAWASGFWGILLCPFTKCYIYIKLILISFRTTACLRQVARRGDSEWRKVQVTLWSPAHGCSLKPSSGVRLKRLLNIYRPSWEQSTS